MIKEYRKLRKFTQERLAKYLEITPRQLQRIEQDEEKTKIKTLKRIIKILQIPDKEIIEFMRR